MREGVTERGRHTILVGQRAPSYQVDLHIIPMCRMRPFTRDRNQADDEAYAAARCFSNALSGTGRSWEGRIAECAWLIALLRVCLAGGTAGEISDSCFVCYHGSQ